MSRSQTFSDAVRTYRDEHGLTYNDLAESCRQARSSSWFWNLLNGGLTDPPPRWLFSGFADMLGVTTERVCEMAAAEWYGVRGRAMSPRVRSLAPGLDALSDSDAEYVKGLVARLGNGAR